MSDTTLITIDASKYVAIPALAQKLRAGLELKALSVAHHTIAVTMSIGVSELAAGHSGAFEILYAAADQALYTAKAQGRNRVEFGVPTAPIAMQHDDGES